MDGNILSPATFPPNVMMEKNSFTVLQSTTGSVFLDVAQNTRYGKETGKLFKSNSNGTFYNMAFEVTNRNSQGTVDFEKVQGVDGIILINQADVNGGRKAIRTYISYDDGASFRRLNQSSGCQDSLCGLNLHSRTTIMDAGTIFTANRAPGILMGVGNAGDSLLDYMDGKTFISKDAGKTWTSIFEEPYRFEYGGQGSIIVSFSKISNVFLILCF